ncbi:hypothetical protein MMC07_007153 [Pseudocyphellaria aurata]|nr:hypothetical protein [Pseudocyphellaria aurata]
MPKIISYTPSWLSRPSPGFHLFSSAKNPADNKKSSERLSNQSINGSKPKKTHIGHVKTIARRGTEIFVAVDNEIRWSDLCMLREENEKGLRRRKSTGVGTTNGGSATEALKYPVGEPIQQLSISPNGTLLAISTSHTVHVVLLPGSSELGQGKTGPIKLKGNNIGPTTHVLSQPRVIRALWHPFGVLGTCLVTVTADAVVRVWELDRDNRWSFDSPSLAIDLKKLVLGTSQQGNFSPERTGRNKGFSPDAVGMEVVSACFGGTGSENESAWSAMTLWIGMQDGDVYALCPLLPTKWAPSNSVIPSLSVVAVSNAALQDDVPADLEESQRQRDQYRWMSDIDNQEPKVIQGSISSSSVRVYTRPSDPGPIPRLQGPFSIFPDDSEQDLELSDLHVIASKIDRDLMDGDDSDSEFEATNEEGLSAAMICLITRSGSVVLCLDLDGVEGEWLPPQEPLNHLPPRDSSLVPFEILETLKHENALVEWPAFSPDACSPHAFFVTHSQGVFFFSMDPWLKSLENELQNTSTTGSTFRIKVLKNGPGTLRERLLGFDQERPFKQLGPATACVVLDDSDLGYFMLTSVGGQPQATILDKPGVETPEVLPIDDEHQYGPDQSTLHIGPPRSVYTVPESFSANSLLPTFVNKQVQLRHKKLLKEEVRLSPVTLGLMTDAHRIVSDETHRIGVSAADLFRRCERLQEELHDQIRHLNNTAYRIEGLLGKNSDDYRVDGERGGGEKGNAVVLKRLEDAKDRQKELVERFERLRGKATGSGGKNLSEKEGLWISEIHQSRDALFQAKTGKNRDNGYDDEHDVANSDLMKRFNEASRIAQDLLSRASEARGGNSSSDAGEERDRGFRVPAQLQRAKVHQVMDLLARESALVDAAVLRLSHLSVSG